MVISGINYQINNNSQTFGAKTRSEREAEREKSYRRMVNVVMTEEDFQMLEMAKKNAERKRRAEEDRVREAYQTQSSEKQYREDVRELKETKSMINDITQNHDFTGGTLQKLGKVADIVITGTLSGMALHWSTGKAFTMIYKVCKKPKVANVLNNIKRPFEIIGSALSEGAKTAWHTMATKVKETPKGKAFLNTKTMNALNEGADELSKAYKNVKTDIKNLKVDDVRSGIATVFGVSGFAAGVVEKLDTPKPNEN